MIARIGRDHPLRKLFGGIIEHVFQTELGICNPRVTDYLADLLADFVHVDRIYNLHDVDGTKLCEISESAASTRLGAVVDDARRRQVVNRFIGDFSLFWTGLYPEQLRLRRRGPDRLREYLLRGKNSYTIAGELTPPNEDPPGALFRQLSEEFEHCVHGLHLVRTQWESN